MKVLVMYVNEFSYVAAEKNLEDAEDSAGGASFADSILAFIQVEQEDENYDVKSREKKLVNHLKWAARKNKCKKITLHSFAHLSGSKASVQFTKEVFDKAEKRLQNADFETAQTPFGYFLDLEIKAPGYSLARIWQSL
ncbi:MAG TPA: threonyl-tRNA synthetase editing domain-containing protein [Prolixibacteraceae bacterium]|nr:threonyl-tRNA synthetase editing domain-containing protein [Prolixibacteraceae bacterium]